MTLATAPLLERAHSAWTVSQQLQARAGSVMRKSMANQSRGELQRAAWVEAREFAVESRERVRRQRASQRPDQSAATLARLLLGWPLGVEVLARAPRPVDAADLRVEVLDVDGQLLVALEGELDRSNVATFLREIGTVAPRGDETVVLDLSRLVFMDVGGLGALRELAAGRSGRIVVRQPPRIVARLLQLLGLEELIS